MWKILKSGDYAIYNGQVYKILFDSQIVSPFKIEGIHYYKAIYKICDITLQDYEGNKIPIASISQLESVYHISTHFELLNIKCDVFGEETDGSLITDINSEQLKVLKSIVLSYWQVEIDFFRVIIPLDKIDSIWYKRESLGIDYNEPIPFNSPKISYIKLYGQWLDEPLNE